VSFVQIGRGGGSLCSDPILGLESRGERGRRRRGRSE